MPTKTNISRRRFLAAAAAASAPIILPACSVTGGARRRSANERITIGLIGTGKRGGTLTHKMLRMDELQIVAVCDVHGARRDHRAQMADDYYGKDKKGTFKGVDRYNDFRDLLDRDDIDAVVIATPDHWHAIQLVEAAKRKKDVYCEKPQTLTIHEAKSCIEVVRKHDIVMQTGSQQRSGYDGRFRRACELVRNGRIGKIKEVYVNVGGPSRFCDLPEQESPPRTDWDMWLGPAPMRGYHEALCPREVHNHFPAFREYREYSGGGMTDWGAHHFDIVQWGLGRDDSGPVDIIPPDGDTHKHLTYRYGDGVLVYHAAKYRGEDVHGVRFIGTDGAVEIDRRRVKTWPETIANEQIGDDELHLYQAHDHMRNWIECIRTRKDPICNVEVGARSVTVCHLGNLAYWYKRHLKWDPKRWEFPGDDEANGWRDRPKRAPWKLDA